MLCDLVIFLILMLFCFIGWKKGFVRIVYSFVSLIVAVAVAYLFTEIFAEAFSKTNLGMKIEDALSSVVPVDKGVDAVFFLISSVIIYLIVRVVMKFIGSFVDLLAKLPIIKSINKILGSCVNLIIGFVWVVIFANSLYLFPQFTSFISESFVLESLGLIFV